MRSLMLAVALMVLTVGPALAAEIPEGDVMVKVEFENFGVTRGLTPVGLPDSSGGYAMALGDEATGATGAVKLEPGDYTLLVRAWAPAGDQDGFFVEIAGKRERRTAPQMTWTAMAYNFKVAKAAPVGISVIGQETGLTVDQIAVVKGTYKTGDVTMAQVPGETKGAQVSIEELPRLSSYCSLKELPEAPFEEDAHILFHKSFDQDMEGAVGDHSEVEGKFGKAVYLQMPDGRYDVDASKLKLGAQGTIEFWVRPRPAQRLWHDQGWHYFLHCQPADGKSFQLDLSRHPKTQLRLTASMGDGPPYHRDESQGTREYLQVSTSSLDLEAWHHLLVSWDLTGKKQYLWLLVDGSGVQLFFPPCFDAVGFSNIEIGNTPSAWDVPFLPIDGAIDELTISDVSVRERLAD